MKNIDTKIQEFKMVLTEGDCDKAVNLLITIALEYDKNIVDDLLLIKERIIRIKTDHLKNIISYDIYSIEISKINDSLLHICNQLNISREENSNVKKKNGKLLYNIPNLMPLGLETKCIIRIGRENVDLLEDLILSEDIKTEDIRVSKIMEVTLVDINNGKNFEIRALNNNEQYLEDDEFSQWIFFVKAISAGNHTLFLRIGTLQIIEQKERKREIVLEKYIQVVTPKESLNCKREWENTNIIISNAESTKATRVISESNVNNTANITINTGVGDNHSITQKKRSVAFIVLFLGVLGVGLAGGILIWNMNKNKRHRIEDNKKVNLSSDTLYNVIDTNSFLNIQPNLIIEYDINDNSNTKRKKIESDSSMIKKHNNNIKKDTKSNSKIDSTFNDSLRKSDIGKNLKNMIFDLIDEIQSKDTVVFGQNLLLTVKTSGIKYGNLVIITDRGEKIRPISTDGNTYYFDIKSTPTNFKLTATDIEINLSKDRIFDGNTNCIWIIKRIAHKVNWWNQKN